MSGRNELASLNLILLLICKSTYHHFELGLAKLLDELPALRNPTISQLSHPEWVAVETIIDEKIVREIIPQLKAPGAEGIIEYPLNKVVY